MPTLRFDISGLRELQGDVDGRAQRTRNAAPVFAAIGRDFVEIEQRAFTGLGGRWKANAPGWQAAKVDRVSRGGKRAIGDPRPLVFTGELRASLTNPRHRYAINSITASEARMGTKDPVANLMKTGTRGAGVAPTRIKRGQTRRTPARNPLKVTPAVRRKWAGWIEAWLVNGTLP